MSTVTKLHALANGMIGKEESSFLHKAASELLDCRTKLSKAETEIARLRMAALRASGWSECDDTEQQ